jgi:hypothetical protein
MTKNEKRSLRKIARTFPGGRRQLILADHVSDDELIAFYRNTLSFVFPSLHEGFGLPLLEAMAVGCPVIASNCSACPEVVGVPEAMFDPMSIESMAGLIGKVIRDQAFRDWLVRMQGERVALFSWRSVAERAWSAMSHLVACGTPRRPPAEASTGHAALVDQVATQLRTAGASFGDFALAAEAIERTVLGVGSGELPMFG